MNEPDPSKPNARRKYRFVRWTLAGLIALVVVMRLSGCVERMVYFPSRRAFETPAGCEDVWFETDDGVRLHGWFMKAGGAASGEPAPAVLHAHGNAGNIETHESYSRFLTGAGFHVLLFDYRRYGRSDDTGPMRRDALARDTRAALDYLLSRPDVDPDRVGVLGVSLGGAFALRAAADEPRVRAVATLSAFSTWGGVASDAVPVIGWLLMPGGDEPVDAAAELGERPLLVMHGLSDRVVRPRHAEILKKAADDAGVACELWTLPGGDHNALVQQSPEARSKLAAFFNEHLGEATHAGP